MCRILNICLLLASLTGYLEWGKDHHAFLWQVEYDLILRPAHSTDAFLHPFIIVPLCGQLLLLFSVFQKTPRRIVSLAGLACLSILMLFLFVIGVMSLNIRIAVSAVPFIVTGFLVLRYNRKRPLRT